MDSSSVVKLYIPAETGWEQVHSIMDAADPAGSSAITYAEVRSALARARRARRIPSTRAYQRILAEFESDWASLFKIEASMELIHRAGDLAERHALSGADAIHLASVLASQQRVPDQVLLSTWDRRLSEAGQQEGLSLAHEVSC